MAHLASYLCFRDCFYAIVHQRTDIIINIQLSSFWHLWEMHLPIQCSNKMLCICLVCHSKGSECYCFLHQWENFQLTFYKNWKDWAGDIFLPLRRIVKILILLKIIKIIFPSEIILIFIWNVTNTFNYKETYRYLII